MRQSWQYNGRNVLVSPTADIANEYRQNGRYAGLVQRALDATKPWKEGEDPIETIDGLHPPLRQIVVSVTPGQEVVWARHVGHKARRPDVSPFVILPLTYRPTTDSFTIELVGSAWQPRLVRAYPGGYIPPLPWQVSARDAPGGRRPCINFWRTHAYVHKPSLVVLDSETSVAPRWFLYN